MPGLTSLENVYHLRWFRRPVSPTNSFLPRGVDRAVEAEMNARVVSFLDHIIIAGYIQILHLYDEIE